MQIDLSSAPIVTGSPVIPPPSRSYALLRYVVAGILMGAALLKAYEQMTGPLLNRSLGPLLQVQLEWILGLCLLSGLYPDTTRKIATACFALFTIVTFWKGIHGARSCGCFGPLQVSPWFTFVGDGIVLAMLLFVRPATSRQKALPRVRLVLLIAAVLLTALPLGIATRQYAPNSITAADGLRDRTSYAVLEPERWLGKPLPLSEFIDISAQLASGRWQLLFLHHDCPDCQKIIQQFAERVLANEDPTLQFAAVELAPYAPAETRELLEACGIACGHLSNDRAWFMATPALVSLNEGGVTRVQDRTSLMCKQPTMPDTAAHPRR